MSSASYEQLLREALVDLSDMQEVDKKSVGLKYGAKKAEDRAYMIQHWSSLYVRYVQVAKKLCQVHDQILQPQKRIDVRILLDSTLGRMLEMKHKMVELCGEYLNFDDVLVDLKLTPNQFEIPIPTYFTEEREEQLKMWNEVISASARRDLESANAPPKPNDLPELPMTLERAIEIIQCNERGRQGRQKAKFHKDVRDQSNAQKKDYEYEQHGDEDRAAFTITRMMKGYLVRKQYQKQRREQLEFLGMEMSDAVASNASLEKLKSKLRIRKDKQKGNEADLGQRAKEMRAKIKVQEGGRIMEEMLDEILMHMANLRLNAEGEMPQFPTEEEGGSLALLNMRPGQLSPEEEAKKKDEEAAAAATAKKPAEKEKKKSDKELEEEALPVIGPSKFWVRVENMRKRYMDTWQKHFHDTYLTDKDFDQEYDKTLLRTEIMEGAGGVISELRKCVDQLVMVEVANLTERIARETMAKRKKQKAKKPPKKKAVKDPSEGKPMDYHTKWLADFGAVQLPEKVRLHDYVGSANLLGSVLDDEERQVQQSLDETKKKWEKLLENWNDYVEQSLRMTKDQFQLLFDNYYQASWNFEPSMQQVRHQVAEYCILPLGSQVVHDLAPNCKSVLFYGPAKTGKTMLTNAVCTEAGANLFCLTPAVINQEGVPLQKLVQTTFRIARALAPSVIYLDEVEKVFMGGKGKKKKGGPDPGKSNKIKKDLQKQMLELSPTDRVVVIGNSSCPWEADQKDFKAFFERFVYVVHPDYASRLLLWQNRCELKGVGLNEADYEVLAYMTSKYSSGTICHIINDTLTDRRIKRIKSKEISADEFLPAMSRAKPIFKEDYDKTKEFSQSLDFRCRKPIFPTDFIQEEDEDDKKKKKAPAKKK